MVGIAKVLTEEYFEKGRRACWGLGSEFNEPYMGRLRNYLVEEESKYPIFPKPERVFEALEETTLEEVKVVIIGQDPYPCLGQAHGLAFSTLCSTRPTSLCNIFDEVKRNMNGRAVAEGHNCLTPWARQGVLLLNRALTVQQGHADAHRGMGWECFTDKIVTIINDHREDVVFMLWGRRAQEMYGLIDPERHKVLCWQHPVGTTKGMERGLSGSKHFFKANQYLKDHGAKPIDWLDVSERPSP